MNYWNNKDKDLGGDKDTHHWINLEYTLQPILGQSFDLKINYNLSNRNMAAILFMAAIVSSIFNYWMDSSDRDCTVTNQNLRSMRLQFSMKWYIYR